MPAVLSVDLYSDVVCPWCLIGNERLEHVRVALLPEVELRVTHHPFMLDPSTPPEGHDVAAMLRQKYGADPARMFAHVESAARESGIPLDLSKQPRSYPTLAAHTLARWARQHGKEREIVRALHAAHFLEARNVADPAVLADIAAAHGLSRDEALALVSDEHALADTRRAADEGVRRGVTGVPFFVLGGRLALSGAQPEEVLKKAIALAVERGLATSE